MRYSRLIKQDIEYINEQANWFPYQAEVFSLLVRGELNDVGIMNDLHMNHRRYYQAKKEIREKIDRILKEKV